MDLFAFRPLAKLPWYIAWKTDPYSQGMGAMQQILPNQYLYVFPIFSIINKFLKKIAKDQAKRMLIEAATWQSHL